MASSIECLCQLRKKSKHRQDSIMNNRDYRYHLVKTSIAGLIQLKESTKETSTFDSLTGTGSQIQHIPNLIQNTQEVFVCIPLVTEETYVPADPGASLQAVFQCAFLVLSPEVFSLRVPIPSKGKSTPCGKLVRLLPHIKITMAKNVNTVLGRKQNTTFIEI